MRIPRGLAAALPVLVLLAACGRSETIGPPPGSGGSGGGTGAGGGAALTVTVAVSPAESSVLSCSGQTTLSATVTGDADHAIDWTADPGVALTPMDSAPTGSGGAGGAGGASADVGSSSVGVAVPDAQVDVRVTATNVAVPSAKSTALVHVRTVLPGAKTIAAHAPGFGDVPAHAMASVRERVYAAYAADTDEGVSLQLARSDDRGATFGSVSSLTGSISIPTGTTLSCVSMAIDAGTASVMGPGSADGDSLYVVFRFSAGSGIASGIAHTESDDAGIGVVEISNGSPPALRVLFASPTVASLPSGVCPDVISPSPGGVVVVFPGEPSGPSLRVWSDGSKTAGFVTGATSASGYVADGQTNALDSLDADVAEGASGADAGESPRLFTDAQGAFCVTYVALTPKGAASQSSAPVIQCSSDRGAHFSDPVSVVSPIDPGQRASSPSGAFSPSGAIALTWTLLAAQDPSASLHVSSAPAMDQPFADASIPLASALVPGTSARSSDVRFDGAGILWLAYHAASGDFAERVFVDKSCDGGMSWSGGGLVNADGATGVDSAVRGGLVPLSSWDPMEKQVTRSTMALSALGFGAEARLYSLTR